MLVGGVGIHSLAKLKSHVVDAVMVSWRVSVNIAVLLQVMHALTSIYDRWRIKLQSVMAEASPAVSASQQHSFPSSYFRSQQNITATSGDNSEDANAASSKTETSTTSASGLKTIPKGLPKALAGEAELVQSQMQQEAAAEGFLKLLGEDEDNLALQKEKEEEEKKAEVAQGKL